MKSYRIILGVCARVCTAAAVTLMKAADMLSAATAHGPNPGGGASWRDGCSWSGCGRWMLSYVNAEWGFRNAEFCLKLYVFLRAVFIERTASHVM